jgi:hypothetical protein
MTAITARSADSVAAAAAYTSSRLTPLLQWFRRFGLVAGVYVAATLTTSAYWMGDTVDYVESIVQFSHGVNHWMWDFAHLLWRPLGWVLASLSAPVTRVFVGSDEHLNVMLTLNAVSWLAGLVCVICLRSLAWRVSGRAWIANVVSICFIFTQVFLNWAHAGSAYVPGLALLLVGFHVSIMRGERPEADARTSVLAGAALAGAVCLWVPYLLVVPAVVFAALCLFGFTRERFRFALQTAVVFSLFTGFAYLAVIAGLRFTTLNEVREWIVSAGHGVDYSGVKRMVFGFARSFISMGNDGLLFKRYLLADPFSPVRLRDLLGATLCKISLVYLFAAGLMINLVFSPHNKRILALLMINGVPVMALAFFFGSSEPERYLPLFPMLFIAVAGCLRGPSRLFRAIVFAFFAVMIVTNSAAVAKPVLHRKQEAAVARVRDLLPRLDARALVYAVTFQDDLMTFSRTYPFHPINRSGRFHLSALVSPGTSWNLHWCEDFAARVLSTWKRGGATWISKRALSQRPRSEWNWAEGDDRRVSWNDFPLLFSHLDLGESVGGDDGFVQLLPSSNNEQFLSRLTTTALVAERKTAPSEK